jgi:hypothetical protein
MMKRILLSLCVIALAAGKGQAELDTLWTRTFGGAYNDGFRSVVKTGDGGFMAVGYTHSFGDAGTNIYAVKTDGDGNPAWARTYGGSGRDYGFSVCEVSGGYAIAGYTTSFGAGDEDAYIVRIDSTGDTLWTKTWGGPARDEGRSIWATRDGGLLIGGATESFGSGESDLCVLKLDANGDTLWTRVFGGALSDWGQSVCETADGCYGVGGTSGSSTANRDLYLVKTSTNGNLVWQRCYGGAGSVDPDWGMSVCATPDSGITLTGYQALEGKDPGEAIILGTDKNGAQVYLRKYTAAYYQYGCGISATHDGGFVVCGATKDPATQKNDLFLAKRISGSGWLWTKTLGGAGSDWGSSIVEPQPGCFVIAGHTQSSGAGGFDGWLIKMCDAAAAVPGDGGKHGGSMMLNVDPNPFGSETSVRFRLAEASTVMLAVYDAGGRRVALLADGPLSPGEFGATWDGRDERGRVVAPGFYVARLAVGGAVQTEKLILVK